MSDNITIEFFDADDASDKLTLRELFAAHAAYSSQFEDGGIAWDDAAIDMIFQTTLQNHDIGRQRIIIARRADNTGHADNDTATDNATAAEPTSTPIIGYAVISCMSRANGDKALEINDMFVEPDMRGQGIGHKLIEHAKLIASQNDIAKLFVRCWNDNTSACEFYKACGMQPKITEFHLSI